MADGYARTSGKVGVAMATSGPGAANMVTGLATAMMDSVPIVCITGQVPRPAIGSDAFQEMDISGAVIPITKHSYCLLYTSPSPRDLSTSRMPSSACTSLGISISTGPGLPDLAIAKASFMVCARFFISITR